MSTPSILAPGFRIMLRNWPALVWTYLLQLGIAVLFSLRLHGEFSAILNHSLAAQRLANGFDFGVLLDTFRRIGEGPTAGPAAAYAGVPIFLLLYILLTAGTLFVYQVSNESSSQTIDEKASLSTLLSTGLRYFWRFVRLLLIAAPVTLLLVGPLSALRTHWLNASDEHGVIEQALFIRGLVTGAILVLIASALRLYFDLTEVYTVQLGISGDRRIRKSLGPAWRAFRSCFAPAYGSFLLIAALGWAGFAFFTWVSLLHLATHYVFFLFLLGQIGMFLLLASRFWQRGMETALALALPIPQPRPARMAPVAKGGESAELLKPVAEPVTEPVEDPIPDPEPEPPYFPPTSEDIGGPPLIS